MIRRLLLGLAFLVIVLAVWAGGVLWLAHRDIDAIDPPLPDPARVFAFDDADLPVGLTWVNTASQEMPRSAVLEPSLDPDPEARYVMAHPSFALAWADGRILLIDVGMDREGALAFGAPIERLSGAAPIEFHGALAERLGDAAGHVSGIVFTHLHADHVGGLTALCETLARDVPVFQTRLQAERINYTTRGGDALLSAARCVHRERLEGDGALPVPGFPGVRVLAAGGHTPGTQMIFARVAGRGGPRDFVFTGDVVNHIAGLRQDLPKPFLYSRFVVPESTERLEKLRVWTRRLVDERKVTPLVSHDRLALEASGIPTR